MTTNVGRSAIRRAAGEALSFLEYRVYPVALVGLAALHGLERAGKVSRGEKWRAGGKDVTEAGVFWLNVGSFALYNALIGYLLPHREEPGTVSLVLFAFAMGVHFVVNDFGLREDHKDAYDRAGRWVAAAAVLAA